MSDSSLSLSLSRDHALVLFDWLSRFNESRRAAFEDQAEERVLWDLQATLESILPEPLSSHYDQLLAAARERVRDDTT